MTSTHYSSSSLSSPRLQGFQKVQCGAAQSSRPGSLPTTRGNACWDASVRNPIPGAGQGFAKTAHDIFGPDVDPSHGPCCLPICQDMTST
eukprot:5713499-Amphidinium_carterae.2